MSQVLYFSCDFYLNQMDLNSFPKSYSPTASCKLWSAMFVLRTRTGCTPSAITSTSWQLTQKRLHRWNLRYENGFYQERHCYPAVALRDPRRRVSSPYTNLLGTIATWHTCVEISHSVCILPVTRYSVPFSLVHDSVLKIWGLRYCVGTSGFSCGLLLLTVASPGIRTSLVSLLCFLLSSIHENICWGLGHLWTHFNFFQDLLSKWPFQDLLSFISFKAVCLNFISSVLHDNCILGMWEFSCASAEFLPCFHA